MQLRSAKPSTANPGIYWFMKKALEVEIIVTYCVCSTSDGFNLLQAGLCPYVDLLAGSWPLAQSISHIALEQS